MVEHSPPLPEGDFFIFGKVSTVFATWSVWFSITTGDPLAFAECHVWRCQHDHVTPVGMVAIGAFDKEALRELS